MQIDEFGYKTYLGFRMRIPVCIKHNRTCGLKLANLADSCVPSGGSCDIGYVRATRPMFVYRLSRNAGEVYLVQLAERGKLSEMILAITCRPAVHIVWITFAAIQPAWHA